MKSLLSFLLRRREAFNERHLLATAGILFGIAILIATAMLLEHDKSVALQTEEDHGRLLASTMESSLSRTLTAVDVTLESVAQIIKDSPATELTQIEERIGSIVAGSSYLRSITVLDTDEKVLLSSREGMRGMRIDLTGLGFKRGIDNMLEAGHPQFARDLFDVSPMLPSKDVAGDRSGAYVVPFARTLLIGERPAILLAAVNPASLFPDFRAALGQSRFATLLSYDGTALANIGRNEYVLGRNYASLPLFTMVHEKHKEFGRFRTGASDKAFIVNYNTARQYPLIAVVGVSEAYVLDAWRADSRELLWLGLVTTLLSFAYTALLWHIMRNREKIGRELKAAMTAAESAYAARGVFLSTMSHEIRTPMNAVIGMASLLRETPLDSEQQEFAKTIEDSAGALLEIINDVLDFSKIDAGKMSIETVEYDLLEIVESSVDILAPKARAKSLSLTSYVDPGLPLLVKGDPGRVRQILLNLTSNAVKFTASGAIEVSARLLDRGRARQVLRFEVSDTGPGLDEETISRLFRPFTQADGSVTRKYGGTGLGLSICKRLVELMGGAIGVNSTPGAGSTFWFELPVAIPALPRAFPSALADAEGKGAVIVAPATRGTDFLRSYLKSWNIPATVAPTLTHAIELPWDSLGVEVVLIDARTIDSADPVLLQRLMNRIGDRRMVLLSASEDERSNVSGHDFAASLIKPFKKAALREAVVGAVSRQASSQSDTPERRQASHEIDIDQALKDDRLILLVEDNVVNQRVAIRQLNLLGYAAHIACNGQEAMDAIAKCRYALVLMDCQMPVMDGYEATRRIRERESEQGGRLQIVALTANAMQGDRERCIAAGMDDYLSKPILREHLQEMLSRRLPLPDSAASEICADTTSAATPVTLADVLNLERLDDIFGDDKHLQQEMLELFISTTRPLLEQFRLAAEQADFNEIAAIGHRLAGSCANIGIDRLAFLGGKAQTAAGMRDAAQSWKLYLEMQSSFALLTEAVTHHKVIA